MLTGLRWWFRARRSGPALLVLAVVALGCLLLADEAMPLPRLGHGYAPWSLLLPAVMAAMTAGVHAAGPVVDEASSRRPVAHVRGLPVALLLSVPVLGWALGVLLGADAGALAASARNYLCYWGLATIALPFVELSAALALPLCYAVAVGVLGDGTQDLWAWPLAAGGSIPASLASALVGIGGWWSLLRSSPRGWRG